MIPVSAGNTGDQQQFANDDDDKFVGPEPKSSSGVLTALKKAEDAFRDWQATCSAIDEVYNLDGYASGSDLDGLGVRDAKLDLFWSSYEVLKPAVYARPPQPVVAPIFKDNKRLANTTAELLERCAVSTLKRTGIDDVMIQTRDDLIFTSRGVIWLTYESQDGKKVCFEHLDRKDFLHEPVRKWSECGWVARRAWMTKAEMRKRFSRDSGKAYQGAKFLKAKDRDGDRSEEDNATTRKAGVWEVWHRADDKVYWVTEGVDVFLDEGAPHLDLSDFFPCPRPAYATKRRRSLIPIPDYERYRAHFAKISDLTRRIYTLLDQVRLMGFVSGGGDLADAIERALEAEDSIEIVQRVNTIGNIAESLAWLPLKEAAEAIQGLIAARAQLIDDFYQLSGISDIMRGASEENETLGAQQLKTQFGSVRVREKSQELQRLAADAVKIACEIIAQKFDQDTLVDMAQMDVPTKSDIKKRKDKLEEAFADEIEQLRETMIKALEQAQQEVNPDEVQRQFDQATAQLKAQKYEPQFEEADGTPTIEAVVALLRDDKAMSFTFEIESSSTILIDELEEKRSRNEFMEVLTKSISSLAGIAQLGPQAIEFWGEGVKFQLAPYRAGRTMDAAVEKFVEAAPEMVANAQSAQGGGEDPEALKQLAEAEKEKAQAAMAKVQADSALKQADNQRKFVEMQQKAFEAEQKHSAEIAKLQMQAADAQTKSEQAQRKLEADIDKIRAETVQILQNIGLAQRQQEMAEFQSVADVQLREGDQQLAQQGQDDQRDAQERGDMRSDRQEDRADRQQDFSEQSTDRQMSLAERQAANEGGQ